MFTYQDKKVFSTRSLGKFLTTLETLNQLNKKVDEEPVEQTEEVVDVAEIRTYPTPYASIIANLDDQVRASTEVTYRSSILQGDFKHSIDLRPPSTEASDFYLETTVPKEERDNRIKILKYIGYIQQRIDQTTLGENGSIIRSADATYAVPKLLSPVYQYNKAIREQLNKIALYIKESEEVTVPSAEFLTKEGTLLTTYISERYGKIRGTTMENMTELLEYHNNYEEMHAKKDVGYSFAAPPNVKPDTDFSLFLRERQSTSERLHMTKQPNMSQNSYLASISLPNIYQHRRNESNICSWSTSNRDKIDPTNLHQTMLNIQHRFLTGIFNFDLSYQYISYLKFWDFVKQCKVNLRDKMRTNTLPKTEEPFAKLIIELLNIMLDFHNSFNKKTEKAIQERYGSTIDENVGITMTKYLLIFLSFTSYTPIPTLTN